MSAFMVSGHIDVAVGWNVKLCIFGRDDDAQAQHFAAVARGRGHEVTQVSFAAMLSGTAAGWAGHGWTVGDVVLDAHDAFIVWQIPANPALLGPPDELAPAATWYRKGKQQEERATLAVSAIYDLEMRGFPLVNPLLASGPFDHKPMQLAVLRRAGLPVPPTLVTNDAAAACAFDDAWRAQGAETILKPAAGGAPARLWGTLERQDLHGAMPSPAIFQRRARGRDVRITVVGREVVSCVAVDHPGDEPVDYRDTEAWRRGEVKLNPCVAPPHVLAMSVRAAELCHHVLSGLDWKHDEARDHWELLEVNSAPVTVGIDRQTHAGIGAAVMRWLERAVEERARL